MRNPPGSYSVFSEMTSG